MKVVLDTNVIVSALLSPSGFSAKIVSLVLTGEITLVYDNDILSEYISVLGRRKLKINGEAAAFLIDFICKEGEFLPGRAQNIVFADEDDRKFYEVYRNQGVNCLITGNAKHFPHEKGIITPRLFVEKINNQGIG